MFRAATAALGLTTSSIYAEEKSGGLRSLIKAPKLKVDEPIDAITSEISKTIPSLMAEHHVPGLGIALIRDGEVAWTGSFGIRSAKTGEPVTDETIFEAASLTKPVFATAAMKLVETGKLDLDRPLSEYLDKPFIPEADQEERLDRVTARHVLSHTTGLPNWRRGKELKFMLDPGTRWGYSGEGYVYLQAVVEHLSGKPTMEFLREQILTPLDMKLTESKWIESYRGHSADAHSAEGKSFGKREWASTNAAASLHTTPREYARFMTLFMEPLRSRELILKARTIEMMLTPQTKVDDPATHGQISWGLGWGLQQSSDGQAFWHWGDNPGFKAFCIGYPEQKIGVAIFSNADLGAKVHRKLIPLALGGDTTALMWKS